MSASVHVAEKMGKGLGAGQILLGKVPQNEGSIDII